MATGYRLRRRRHHIAQIATENAIVTSDTTCVLDTATSPTMVLAETDWVSGQTTTYWYGLDILAQSDSAIVTCFEYDGLGSAR